MLILAMHNFFPYTFESKDLQTYVQDFVTKMDNYCDSKYIRLDIQKSVLIVDKIPFAEKDVIGLCIFKPLGFDVFILRKFWDKSSSVERRELVYHELLHCYLNVRHQDGTIMDPHFIGFGPISLERELYEQFEKACTK